MLFRRRPRRWVAIRAAAPGRPGCTLPLAVIADQVERAGGDMPLWEMFWPGPDTGGAHYELVYDRADWW